MTLEKAFARLSAAPALADDFNALTATGGRLVGSPSEAAAREWLQERLRKIPEARFATHPFQYLGWACTSSSLELVAPDGPKKLAYHPLYWSPETPDDGLESNVIDVGRGTEAEFDALAARIPGQIVVVRHEYPFSRETVHRSLKYDRSLQCGAAGFIIVNNNPGSLLVTGACSGDSPNNIPAMGVSLETGAMLTVSNAARVRMCIAATRQSSTGVHLVAEIAGQTPEWVVLCAHYDGHDLAQSALDNATGVAAAITIFESFAPFVARLRRGLRLMLFTAEESRLMGSRFLLQSLPDSEQRKMSVVLNLDTLCGSSNLTCLVSGFAELQNFVSRSCSTMGVDELPCYLPLMRNSDHFNFAQRGIPAIRLVAGFDEPKAGARFLLTEVDTRERVSLDELRRATITAGVLAWSALEWPGRIAAHKAPIALV
jgi:aminopeptidase YwaD